MFFQIFEGLNVEEDTRLEETNHVGWWYRGLDQIGSDVIATYSIDYFKLPYGIFLHINSLIRSYWWESKEIKMKPHWFSHC
jgi:hypothetical protein